MEIKNNIEEKYCSFELSKLLKEKGFKVLPPNTVPTDYIMGYDFDIEDADDVLKTREFQWEDCQCNHLYLRPTHAVVIEWLRVNYNMHVELIWDIEMGEIKWFCSLTSIGDVEGNSVDSSFQDSPEKAIDATLLYALGQKPSEKVTVSGIDYDSIKEAVLEEYKKGNVVFAGLDYIEAVSLLSFVNQPIEGLLYDLNRNETTVLALIKDQKWINDYAVCKVITELKKQLDEHLEEPAPTGEHPEESTY